MKFLFINGSPHKGNTWKLAELVKEGLLIKNNDSTFEEIHLSELNLPFCCGCSNCFRLGYEKCPHFSKIKIITEAIDKSDGVIFTSTTYNMRETALLKNLFDHLCFMLHRPYFFKSKALVLTTTGGVGAKKSANSIKSMLKGIGFNSCYQFSCASLSWNNYIPKEKTKKSLSNTTAKFFYDVSSKRLHAPTSLVLIPYNLFRGMSLAYVKGTEYQTQDGIFWSQEDRHNYVYEKSIKVPFYKKTIGQFFYIIGKLAGKSKNLMVTYKK